MTCQYCRRWNVYGVTGCAGCGAPVDPRQPAVLYDPQVVDNNCVNLRSGNLSDGDPVGRWTDFYAEQLQHSFNLFDSSVFESLR